MKTMLETAHDYEGQITCWDAAGVDVFTTRGLISYKHWLRREQDRAAALGIATHVEAGRGRHAGQIALFRGVAESDDLDSTACRAHHPAD